MLKKKHIKKKDTYTQVIYVQLKPTFALKENKMSYSITTKRNKRKRYKKFFKVAKQSQNFLKNNAN